MSITLAILFLGAIVGVGVAWAAERAQYSPGFGGLLDYLVAVIGAEVALGYAARSGLPAGTVATVVTAAVGAAVLLALARLVVVYRSRAATPSPVPAAPAAAPKGKPAAVDRSSPVARAARSAAR